MPSPYGAESVRGRAGPVAGPTGGESVRGRPRPVAGPPRGESVRPVANPALLLLLRERPVRARRLPGPLAHRGRRRHRARAARRGHRLVHAPRGSLRRPHRRHEEPGRGSDHRPCPRPRDRQRGGEPGPRSRRAPGGRARRPGHRGPHPGSGPRRTAPRPRRRLRARPAPLAGRGRGRLGRAARALRKAAPCRRTDLAKALDGAGPRHLHAATSSLASASATCTPTTPSATRASRSTN